MTDQHQQQCSQIPSYALKLINSIAAKEGFTEYSVTPAAGSNHGDGFQGIMIRVTIDGLRKSNGFSQHDKLSLICKMPPHDKVRREMFNSRISFEKEIYAYEQLLPTMVKFQQERGLSPADGFYLFPKCYGTFADATNIDYVLVMEDLKVNGYEMWDKHKTLDFNHARMALTQLGKYHAISFAIRDQRPDIFKEFQQNKPDLLLKMLENETSATFWTKNYEMAAGSLEPHETDWIKRILDLRTSFVEKMRDCCAENVAEPFSVMNHGDFWNNNMMYHYTKGNSIPNAVNFIDWQIAQMCSPAMDVSYFLFSSTEKSLRDAHYDELLSIYHGSLAKTLKLLGSDAEKLFKFSDLQDQMKRFAKYGLLMAPMLIQVVTANPDDIPDLDELAKKMNANPNEEFQGFIKENDPVYRKRMSDTIRDFFDRKYDL